MKIEELEFNLKIIGLRTAYKSFIDLFVYIFKLEDKKKLDENIDNIKKFLNQFNNEKAKSIIKLINDIFYLINDANSKAHYINFEEKLLSQILDDIAKYTRNDGHLKVLEILDRFNVEDKFKELVKIRTNKYKLSYDNFKQKENIIINSIRNNTYNKDGLNLLTK